MICPKCNSEIKNESNFCSKCGAKCDTMATDNSKSSKQKQEKFFVDEVNVNHNGSDGILMIYNNQIVYKDNKINSSITYNYSEDIDEANVIYNRVKLKHVDEKYRDTYIDEFKFKDDYEANKYCDIINDSLNDWYNTMVMNEEENEEANEQETTEENYVQSNNGMSGWGVLLFLFIIADVISWIIFAVTQSGLFGMLGMFFLIMSLAIISGFLGVDTSKIDDRNEEERRIRRETRIKMDEAKKYYNNWKNIK